MTTANKSKPAEAEAPKTGLKNPALKFKVINVEKTLAPEGTAGTWHQYIIKNQSSTITGSRRGTKREVVQHANDYAERLNERYISGARTTWTVGRRKTVNTANTANTSTSANASKSA